MKHHLTTAILGLLALASCVSPPRLSDSWRAPDAPEFQAKKTLVVVMSNERSFRRVVEDELANRFAKGAGVASYTILADADLGDTQKAAEHARTQGFDGALVVRVLGVDELPQRVPGSYAPVYVTFTGASAGAAYVWPTGFDEGYTYMEKTYRLETSLYSLADDKLVWSGVVNVRDPDSVRELAAWNSQAVLPELRRQKLLP